MSRIIVDSLRGNSASSDAISLANDGTCTANITNNLSNRNKVINGAMVVNQRSGTYNRPTGDEYTVDRFETRTGSSFNFDTLTTQDSSAPNGFSKSLKITPQTTQTPSGSHNGMFAHLIEADNLLGFASGTSSAKKFVLSFYAKSASQNNNHQYSVQLSKINSGGNFYYQNRSFTVTSSWQRFTVAFPADTSNNITTGNGEGLRILWHLAAGSDDIASAVTSWTSSNGNHAVTGQSNFMDNTSNEFYLTGVQLEASDSDVATDFEHRSFGQELELCRRYYQVLVDDGSGKSFGNGTCYTDSNMHLILQLSPNMRTTPTIDQVVGTNYYRMFRNGGETTFSQFSLEASSSSKIVDIYATGASGSQGASALLRTDNAAAKIRFSAEL